MSRETTSFYEILEVGNNATVEEIEAAYQRLCGYLDNHSLATYSILDETESQSARSELIEAYQVLRDPERRAAYDRNWKSPDTGSYPFVLVPETSGGASVSVGMVDAEKPTTPTPVAHRVDKPVARLTPRPTAKVPLGTGRPGPKRLAPTIAVELTAETEFNGSLLRRLRESCGASIDDVAEITKINKRYLKAIEENDFASLPAAVYVRGFILEYAKIMGLDGAQVAKSYMDIYKRYRTDS